MCKLKAADFYYGAFVSALLNTPGGRPSLFEETGSRRIYRLETNNNSESYFFAKYASAVKNKNDRYEHWIFNFSTTEIEKLIELRQTKNDVKIVLICAKEGLKDSELAIVDYEDGMDCLGVACGTKGYRLNIKAIEAKHGLRMYGSGRSDKLNGKDNTLKISRNKLVEL